MMKSMYVPGHLLAALEAAGVKTAKDYTIENLVNIVSPEDVAFYCYLNMSLKLVLPEAIVESLPSAWANGYDPLVSQGSEDGRVTEVLRLLNEYCLNDSAPPLQVDGLHLTSELFDEDTIRFTHIPYEAGASNVAASLSPAAIERAVLDRVIQQLHGFMPFESIAQLPLFAGYLQTSQTLLSNAPLH